MEEGGFFYDMSLEGGRTIGPDDYKGIEDVCRLAVKEKQAFERLELPKEVLLEMFRVCYMIIIAGRKQLMSRHYAVQQVQATLHQ